MYFCRGVSIANSGCNITWEFVMLSLQWNTQIIVFPQSTFLLLFYSRFQKAICPQVFHWLTPLKVEHRDLWYSAIFIYTCTAGVEYNKNPTKNAFKLPYLKNSAFLSRREHNFEPWVFGKYINHSLRTCIPCYHSVCLTHSLQPELLTVHIIIRLIIFILKFVFFQVEKVF